jgi:hypothetical protein
MSDNLALFILRRAKSPSCGFELGGGVDARRVLRDALPLLARTSRWLSLGVNALAPGMRDGGNDESTAILDCGVLERSTLCDGFGILDEANTVATAMSAVAVNRFCTCNYFSTAAHMLARRCETSVST